MKKQIYGITLCIVIVGVSVFIYEYFNYSSYTDCGAVMSARCVSTTEPLGPPLSELDRYEVREVVVKLKYVEASMKNEAVKARLLLDWQGAATPPKSVWVQLQFHNYEGSGTGWVSEPVRINEPFEGGWVREVEPVFECGRCANLPRNLYATARVWTKANAGQNLLYEIKGMQPVLVQE